MKKTTCVFMVVVLLLSIIGCGRTEESIKRQARYIKHSEMVNNFETYEGDTVKVEGVVFFRK